MKSFQWYWSAASKLAECHGCGGCSLRSNRRVDAPGATAPRECDRIPARILSGHLHHQLHDLWCDRQPTWMHAIICTVELLGNQPAYQARIVSGLATTAI